MQNSQGMRLVDRNYKNVPMNRMSNPAACGCCATIIDLSSPFHNLANERLALKNAGARRDFEAD